MLTNILPHIVCANMETAEEQHNFYLADRDRAQWQVTHSRLHFTHFHVLQNRDPAIEGILTQKLITYLLPCSDKRKHEEFEHHFSDHMSNIFLDESVHMLMVMLVLFDSQDVDEGVRKVHYTSLNMLRGYLEAHNSTPEFEFHRILKCVKDVPHITERRARLVASFRTPTR